MNLFIKGSKRDTETSWAAQLGIACPDEIIQSEKFYFFKLQHAVGQAVSAAVNLWPLLACHICKCANVRVISIKMRNTCHTEVCRHFVQAEPFFFGVCDVDVVQSKPVTNFALHTRRMRNFLCCPLTYNMSCLKVCSTVTGAGKAHCDYHHHHHDHLQWQWRCHQH